MRGQEVSIFDGSMDIVLAAASGVESVIKRELVALGYPPVPSINGRMTLKGTFDDVVKLNLHLRTADRVSVCLGKFGAATFDELFDGIYGLTWKEILPANARITVTAKSVNSKLFALSAIQSIAKKAIAENLKKAYRLPVLPETGPEYNVNVSVTADTAVLDLNTSGAGLHKRGYRVKNGLAPIKETLAAAIIMLSGWTADRPFTDPFAGSGTFPIEAALMAMNIAPGLNRSFAFEQWVNCPDRAKALKAEAASMIATPDKLRISGFDIDAKSVKLAAEHAALAGVGDKIHFQKADMRTLSSRYKGGYIVTNPPYGERLLSYEETLELYRDFGKVFRSLDDWNLSIITAFKNFEKAFGRKADKNRKLYNSQLECRLYIYKSRGLNN